MNNGGRIEAGEGLDLRRPGQPRLVSGGDDDRNDISSTFLQPFLAYPTPRHTTFTVNTEATYNWEEEQWSVPINLMVTQLFKVGDQPMSLQLGARYWADSPRPDRRAGVCASPTPWFFPNKEHFSTKLISVPEVIDHETFMSYDGKP